MEDELVQITDEERALMADCAVGNISMLAQIAAGTYKAKPGEVDERAAWLVLFVRTGVGLVTPEAEREVAAVRAALAGVAA